MSGHSVLCSLPCMSQRCKEEVYAGGHCTPGVIGCGSLHAMGLLLSGHPDTQSCQQATGTC